MKNYYIRYLSTWTVISQTRIFMSTDIVKVYSVGKKQTVINVGKGS